jgi:hypothetical protein
MGGQPDIAKVHLTDIWTAAEATDPKVYAFLHADVADSG